MKSHLLYQIQLKLSFHLCLHIITGHGQLILQYLKPPLVILILLQLVLQPWTLFLYPSLSASKKHYGCWFRAKSQAQILCVSSHSSFLHQFTSLPFFTFWSFLFFPFTASLPIISTYYCYICHWHSLFFTNNIFLSLKKRMEELLNCHPIIYNHHLLLVY